MSQASENPSLKIRFSRARLLLVFAPVAILVVISLAINFDAWLSMAPRTAALWAGLILLVVTGCVVMPRCYYLELSPQGLRVQYVGTQRFYRWHEMRDFRVGSQTGMSATANMIQFDLSADSPQRGLLTKLTSVVNRYDVSIMATYELGADEIIDLLNEWQARYANSAATESVTEESDHE